MHKAIQGIVRYFLSTRVGYVNAKADADGWKWELRRSRRRVTELEHKRELLEAECDGLRQELANSAVASEAVTPD